MRYEPSAAGGTGPTKDATVELVLVLAAILIAAGSTVASLRLGGHPDETARQEPAATRP